jgi:hypothetical protein
MEISNEIIPRLLRDFFKKIPDSGIKTITNAKRRSVIVDNTYSPVTQSEILEIIKSNPLLVPNSQVTVNNELSDCDDYALQLKASTTALYRQRMLANDRLFPPAVAIVITQSHALNLVITESEGGDPTPSIIDPSETEPIFLDDPKQGSHALGILPIKLIYI